MYYGVLKTVGVVAATATVLTGILSFDDLGVKELVETKVSGLVQNQDKLQTQKTILLNKVNELSGNIETLISQKKSLLMEIEKLRLISTTNDEEIIKLEKLVDQLNNQINSFKEEKDSLIKEINGLEENTTLLKEQIENQRKETEKANDYIKKLEEYINSINVENVPELDTLPSYKIDSLEDELPSDSETSSPDAIWNTNNNHNIKAFVYDGLGFQITESDGKNAIWFFDDRSSKDNINVDFEYTGVDDKTYTVKLEHNKHNILSVSPKKYNKIVINYSDGTKKVIAIV